MYAIILASYFIEKEGIKAALMGYDKKININIRYDLKRRSLTDLA